MCIRFGKCDWTCSLTWIFNISPQPPKPFQLLQRFPKMIKFQEAQTSCFQTDYKTFFLSDVNQLSLSTIPRRQIQSKMFDAGRWREKSENSWLLETQISLPWSALSREGASRPLARSCFKRNEIRTKNSQALCVCARVYGGVTWGFADDKWQRALSSAPQRHKAKERKKERRLSQGKFARRIRSEAAIHEGKKQRANEISWMNRSGLDEIALAIDIREG